MRQHKYDYDAFISHAVEDKIPIANELCARLEQAGLRIWYSGKELGVGDSIEKTIENGLHRSRYGIVILSPTYLAKNWTIREFYTLLAKEIEEHKVILPVLYNITPDELKSRDLLMADRFAVNADRGLDHVVDRLVHEIRRPKLQKARTAWFSRIWAALAVSLLINAGFLLNSVLEKGEVRTASVREAGTVFNAGMVDRVEGLFARLTECTCGHTAPQLTRDPSGVLRMANLNDYNARSDGAIAHQKPAKMTMAVVFQFETLSPEAKHTTHKRMDEVMETIGLGTGDQFVMVSNRDTRKDCLQVEYAGE